MASKWRARLRMEGIHPGCDCFFRFYFLKKQKAVDILYIIIITFQTLSVNKENEKLRKNQEVL